VGACYSCQGWASTTCCVDSGTLSYCCCHLRRSALFIAGVGCSQHAIDLCCSRPRLLVPVPRCVFLPMFGFTESLNVGVAAALVSPGAEQCGLQQLRQAGLRVGGEAKLAPLIIGVYLLQCVSAAGAAVAHSC
jgi:hypothetical protein